LPSGSPLEFFVDRSLGRRVVPEALREAGAVVHVMADVYGERIGQGLADEEWLRDAGERGWVVLMKDAKIRYRPAELKILIGSGLRAFCLTNASMRGIEMAERFAEHLPRIVRIASEQPGPYIYGVIVCVSRPTSPGSAASRSSARARTAARRPWTTISGWAAPGGGWRVPGRADARQRQPHRRLHASRTPRR
jgi:hypothetical protein